MESLQIVQAAVGPVVNYVFNCTSFQAQSLVNIVPCRQLLLKLRIFDIDLFIFFLVLNSILLLIVFIYVVSLNIFIDTVLLFLLIGIVLLF